MGEKSEVVSVCGVGGRFEGITLIVGLRLKMFDAFHRFTVQPSFVSSLLFFFFFF